MGARDSRFDRRTLVRTVASAAALGLAGCTGDGGGGGGGDDGDGGSGDGGDGGGSPTPTSGGIQTPDPTPAGDAVGSEARTRVEEFLSGVGNFDGTIVDATGASTVQVAVGAPGNGGDFAFEPPAVAVSPSATVSWRWTGKGGQHNVVSQPESDFDFSSGRPKTSGDPYEQSFDGTGVGLYLCEPHASLGMKGAVVVLSG